VLTMRLICSGVMGGSGILPECAGLDGVDGLAASVMMDWDSTERGWTGRAVLRDALVRQRSDHTRFKFEDRSLKTHVLWMQVFHQGIFRAGCEVPGTGCLPSMTSAGSGVLSASRRLPHAVTRNHMIMSILQLQHHR